MRKVEVRLPKWLAHGHLWPGLRPESSDGLSTMTLPQHFDGSLLGLGESSLFLGKSLLVLKLWLDWRGPWGGEISNNHLAAVYPTDSLQQGLPLSPWANIEDSYRDSRGFPGGPSGKEPACHQCRRPKRHRFDPWVGKIPWRSARQSTPLFVPGESHGQGNLVSYGPQGHEESATTEWLSMQAHIRKQWIAQEEIWKATALPALPGNSFKLLRSEAICKALQETWPNDTLCWELMFLLIGCVCSFLKILSTHWHPPPRPTVTASTQPSIYQHNRIKGSPPGLIHQTGHCLQTFRDLLYLGLNVGGGGVKLTGFL